MAPPDFSHNQRHMNTTATTSRRLTEIEKRNLCARIQQHIHDRDLVAKRLEELPTSVQAEPSAQAKAFAYVFVLQLSFRGIESETLCWDLAQLAGISRENYDAAVRAI